MRADICKSNDELATARFREVLRRMGAELVEKTGAIGVDLYQLKIGDEQLSVFTDPWSTDIEGSEQLVQRVLSEFASTPVEQPDAMDSR